MLQLKKKKKCFTECENLWEKNKETKENMDSGNIERGRHEKIILFLFHDVDVVPGGDHSFSYRQRLFVRVASS